MDIKLLKFLLTVMIIVANSMAFANPIDCKKALHNQVEKLVCNSPELMAKDQEAEAAYKKAVSYAKLLPDNANAKHAVDEIDGIHSVDLKYRNRCKNEACLQKAYSSLENQNCAYSNIHCTFDEVTRVR